MPTLPTKAIKGLIQKNGKILLLQRQKKPGDTANWDLPGGLCEPGETEVDALKREIQEELGVEVVVGKPTGSWFFIRPTDGQKVLAQNYVCHLKNIDTSIMLSGEHTDYVWISPKEITRFPIKNQSLAETILQELGDIK